MIYPANELDLLEASSLPDRQPILSVHLVLSSALELSRLYQALYDIISIVPQLGCRFDQKSNAWISLPLDPSALVKEVETIDFSCWNVQEDPQIQIQIKKDGHHAAIGFSHIVTDANGAKQLMYLLCDAYHGSVDKTLRNQRELTGLSVKQVAGVKKKSQKNHFLVMKTQKDTGNSVVCARGIDLSLLTYISRQTQTTVNDILLCAFLQTLHTLTGQNDISLPCPVDLRRFLKDCPLLTVTNFIGDYKVTITGMERKSWKDILTEIHEQMLQERSRNRQLKMLIPLHRCYQVLPKSLCVWMAKKAYHTPAVSLTNPGILDEKRLRFGGNKIVQAYIVSRIQRYPTLQISVSTFQGVCTLACHVDGTVEEIKVVHKILKQMERCLNMYKEQCDE